MARLRRLTRLLWQHVLRFLKLIFLLALIAVPVPIAVFVTALLRPKRAQVTQVEKKK